MHYFGTRLAQQSDTETHIHLNDVPRKKPRQPGGLVGRNGDMVSLTGGAERCCQKDYPHGVVAQGKTGDFGTNRELDPWAWSFSLSMSLSFGRGTSTLKIMDDECISDRTAETLPLCNVKSTRTYWCLELHGECPTDLEILLVYGSYDLECVLSINQRCRSSQERYN